MQGSLREIELKFLVEPQRAETVFAGLSGRALKTLILTSIYFDTPDRRLAKAGITLRVRNDGRRWVQTVKSDAVGDGCLGRYEAEGEVASFAPDEALLARTPAGAALKGAEDLHPVFTVKLERRAMICREAGSSLEVCLDRGEIAAGGASLAICEMEAELKSGSAEALLAFGARLCKSAGLRPSFVTKAQRGFELASAKPARARRFRAPRLDGAITTGAAFRAIARAALEQITGNAERLRESPGPEVIHQMRVGARRLRSALSTFKPIVSDRRLAAIQAELKWLTLELDPARNLDVLLAGAYRRAAVKKVDKVGLADLGRRLRLARTAAYARAGAAADSERLAALIMDAMTWIEAGPWSAETAPGAAVRDGPVVEFSARALDRRLGKVIKRGRRLAKLDPVTRHHLRIEAKKLRYAADVFAGLFGHARRARRFLSARKVLQDRLGELNDIATGETLAHELLRSAGIAGDADWAAGRLIGEEHAREADLIPAAERAFKALRQAEPFWLAI
jgi:inorganic triphosphatase YgiF